MVDASGLLGRRIVEAARLAALMHRYQETVGTEMGSTGQPTRPGGARTWRSTDGALSLTGGCRMQPPNAEGEPQ